MTRLLSVLDQSPISEGSTGGDALRNSIDLAQLAELVGYRRYWVAERLATSSRMALSLLRTTGRMIPVPTVETATRFLHEPAGALPIARRRRMTLGTKPMVRDGLEAIAREYDAEEIMIVTITHSHEARKQSYRLVPTHSISGQQVETQVEGARIA